MLVAESDRSQDAFNYIRMYVETGYKMRMGSKQESFSIHMYANRSAESRAA